MILLFGLKETEGMVSHYYRDEKNDLWVGEVPYTDKTTLLWLHEEDVLDAP